MIARKEKTIISTPDQMNKRNQKYISNPDSNIYLFILLSCYLNQTELTEEYIS